MSSNVRGVVYDRRPQHDERVMDHIRNARAYRVLEDATHQANGINPLCGDEMTVYVRISADRVEELAYQPKNRS